MTKHCRFADIKPNDIVDGEGVCVSFWTQGCPFRCKGCHNPDTWDFNGGESLPANIVDILAQYITANNVTRNFSVLGGEPLCIENLDLTSYIVEQIRTRFPEIKIYLWSGYTYENLNTSENASIQTILNCIDVLIDGPYIEAHRDITLKLRGSTNQRVIDVKRTRQENKIILYCD